VGWGPGINSEGIASVHTSVIALDNLPGLPYPFLSRRILRAITLADAVEAVSSVANTTGCHFLMAKATEGVDVCVVGNSSQPIRLNGETVAVGNYFESPPLDKVSQPLPGSDFRVGRLRALVGDYAKMSPKNLFEIYSDHANGPLGHSVCMHGLDDMDTHGFIVVDPVSLTLWAKAGHVCEDRPVTEITLGDGEASVGSPGWSASIQRL
jgi:hypothetical protein